MNSIFNCFHAGVNFVSACFGTSTRLPTSTDSAPDEGLAAQVLVQARNQHEDTTTTNDLIQDHSLQESMHEAKHDTQPALSEVKEQPSPPNIVNVIPKPVCSPHQTNTTGVLKHTVPALSTLTSIPHTRDLMQHNQPVAHRTRSNLTKNRNMHNTSPGIRSTTNKHPKKCQQVSTTSHTTLVQVTDSHRVQASKERNQGRSWCTLASLRQICHRPLLASVEITVFIYDEMQWTPQPRSRVPFPTMCGACLRTRPVSCPASSPRPCLPSAQHLPGLAQHHQVPASSLDFLGSGD